MDRANFSPRRKLGAILATWLRARRLCRGVLATPRAQPGGKGFLTAFSSSGVGGRAGAVWARRDGGGPGGRDGLRRRDPSRSVLRNPVGLRRASLGRGGPARRQGRCAWRGGCGRSGRSRRRRVGGGSRGRRWYHRGVGGGGRRRSGQRVLLRLRSRRYGAREAAPRAASALLTCEQLRVGQRGRRRAVVAEARRASAVLAART